MELKKKVVGFGVLITAVFFFGCDNSKVERSSLCFKQASAVVDKIERSCLKPKYEPYIKFYKEIWGCTESIVQQQKAPCVVEQMVYVAIERLRQLPDRQDMLQTPEMDVYLSVESQALFHLAEMRTDASAEVLVNLYIDPELGWDSSRSLDMNNAITRCGKSTLPYLKKYHHRKQPRYDSISDLIRLVERGEQYGY